MTQSLHTEAEQTRALWREYLANNETLYSGASWPDDAEAVGRIVKLLREQKRILNELLPEEK